MTPRALIGSFLWLLLTAASAAAQGNALRFSTDEVPDALNVCAGEDRWIVSVGLENGIPAATQLTAAAELFAGVRFVALDPTVTSAGVTLLSGVDSGNPVFGLPDLDNTTLPEVQIGFTVRAGCGYTDTLAQNNQVQVRDRWTLTYADAAGGTAEEVYPTVEYRDAFAQPFFSIDIFNGAPPLRIGECFERKVQVSNSALTGYAAQFDYSVRQGGGVYLDRIELGGQPLSLSRTALASGDTLIGTTLDGSHFVNFNNGDARFDPDESLELVEYYCVTSCALPSTSLHQVSWGCDDKVCAQVLQVDEIPLGQGTPNPTFAPDGDLPNRPAGYCADGQLSVTYTNDGVEFDAGFGTMNDVALGLAFGAGYLIQQGEFRITGITVGSVPIIIYQGVNTLDGHPQFTTDPDGPGGLTDSDGDGYYDDLPVDASVEVTAFYTFGCANTTQVVPDDNCFNDQSVNFFSRIDYRDRCREAQFRQSSNFYRASNRNGTVDNFTDPDARAELDTFYLVHQQTRAVNNFAAACADGEFRVRVAKPAGVHALPDLSTLTYNGFAPLDLLDLTETADSLYLTFSSASALDLSGEYELRLGLQADCTTAPGPTSFPLGLAHHCPGCNCDHLWYCGTLDGPSVQIESPPCQLIDCDAGLQVETFDVARTTFGYADAAYQTPADPAAVNTQVALSCDSVRFDVLATVGALPVSDSLGLQFQYDNIDGSDDGAATFRYGGGTVTFIQNGTPFSCVVDTFQHGVVLDSITQRHTIDLSDCLTALGLTLQPGDSIRFSGQFSVAPDGAYDVQFASLPNFRASGYGIFNAKKESCGSLGSVFTVAKTLTAFDFPTNDDFPTGCTPTQLDYRLITINNGFSSQFPNEFRPAVKVDSFAIDFDPALLDAYDDIVVTGALPGHPVHGDAFFPLPSLHDFPDGRYRLRFDTLVQVPSLNAVQTYAFDLRIELVPTCRSATGSSAGNNVFDFDPEISFIDRYYALTIGDGSCSTVRQRAINNDLVYTEPPSVALTAVGNPDQLTGGDTVVWTLQLCNTSFESDAGVSWLALDADSAITVLEVTDISDPTIQQDYPVQAYGNGDYFVVSNGLRKANAGGGLNASCNRYRVRAVVDRCGTLPITARGGYNCAPYPADWTPADYAPCTERTLPLSVTTLRPFLEAEVVGQAATLGAVCDTQTVTILLRNDDRGAAFDLRTQFVLPATGATLLPGGTRIAYPSGAALQPALFDPTYAGNTARGQAFHYASFDSLHTQLGLTGLPGFDPANPTDSNELRLQFRFVTDCHFTGGSLAYYDFEARSACGEASNFEAGETLPLYLDGATPDPDKAFDLDLPTNQNLDPSTTSFLEVSARNLTATPTDTTDLLRADLPPGVSYVAGTSTASLPTNFSPGEPEVRTVGGTQQLRWPFPAGLLQNEQFQLRFGVSAPTLDCAGTSPAFRFATASTTGLACGNSGADRTVETLHGGTGDVLFNFPVGSNLTLNFDAAFSDCTLDFETLQLSGTLSTTSGGLATQDYRIRYYYDQNADGELQPSDSLLATFSLPLANAVPVLPFQHAVATRSAWICDLLVEATPLGNDGCTAATVSKLPLPQLRNAGADTLVCAASAQTLTYQAGHPDCTNTETNYLWTALAPAQPSDLSNPTVAAPVITYAHPGTDAPALIYVLRSTRGSCGIPSFDTLRIERPGGVEVLANSMDTNICTGNYTELFVSATGSNLSYQWNPVPLIGQGSNRVRVAPLVSTTYSVTVSGGTGCAETIAIDVTVDACADTCVPPFIQQISTTDATCGNADGSITLTNADPTAALVYTWTPDLGTSNATGNARTGLPFGAYTVTASRVNDATCSTTKTVFLYNSDGPDAGVTTDPASCALSDGGAQLSPTDYAYTWPDGSTATLRNDLAAGVYAVTFTDPAYPDCPNVLAVNISETSALVASVSFDQLPDCNGSTGVATLSVSGGSGNYSYDWPGGAATQTGLTPGVHTVQIDDVDTGCGLSYAFVLPAQVPAATVLLTDTLVVSCSGAADGGIDFALDFAVGFAQPAAVTITDGFTDYSNNELPPGTYCLVVRDANGCVAGGACFAIAPASPLQLTATTSPACADGGTLALDIVGGSAPYSIDWAGLIPTNTTITNNLAAGNYAYTLTDANACTLPGTVTIPACVDCPLFETDSVYLQTQGCAGALTYCLPEAATDFTFSLNNQAYSEPLGFCAYDTLGLYAYAALYQQGNGGPYAVEWTVNGTTYTGAFDDLDGLLDSLRTWDPAADWRYATTGPFLVGDTNGGYSALTIEVLDLGITNVLNYEEQYLPTGRSLALPLGNYWLTATMASSCADSVFVNGFCTPTDTLVVDLVLNASDTLCFSAVVLPGNFAALSLDCLDGLISETNPLDSCVVFTGTGIGSDTACVVLCDELGFCANSAVIVNVVPPVASDTLLLVDTVLIGGAAEVFCFDTDLLPGSALELVEVCPNINMAVDFAIDFDSYCVVYTGLAAGTDTLCVQLLDELGNTVRYELHVTAVALGPTYVKDTVFVNEEAGYCLATDRLPGPVVSVEELCPSLASGAVEFFVNPIDYCVEYTGLRTGRDTACMAVCDAAGNCDTTYFCLLVRPFLNPPRARPDSVSTLRATPTIIDIKANDLLLGNLDTAYLVDLPNTLLSGTAVLNPDCSVTYNPDPEFCDRSDELAYVICNEYGCDTALVTVYINCIELTIFTAVSPNGDGFNDFFHISRIEDFPDNRLRIYNRWGNLVYDRREYENDWPGQFSDDTLLPDGAYFFILEWRDNDAEFVQRGYLELFR